MRFNVAPLSPSSLFMLAWEPDGFFCSSVCSVSFILTRLGRAPERDNKERECICQPASGGKPPSRCSTKKPTIENFPLLSPYRTDIDFRIFMIAPFSVQRIGYKFFTIFTSGHGTHSDLHHHLHLLHPLFVGLSTGKRLNPTVASSIGGILPISFFLHIHP